MLLSDPAMSELLPTVAGFLDFKALARVCGCSKECAKSLAEAFQSQAHPSAVKLVAVQIIAERMRAPCAERPAMVVRSDVRLQFSNLDEGGAGMMTLFGVDVQDDGSIKISAAYGTNDGEVMTSVGHASAILTLDPLKPMRCGKVRISDAEAVISTIEYRDGISLREAMGWCPLIMQ